MALIDDLVSYWKLDEASGTRADSHGSNDLTDNNTVGSATGKIGNAADFENDSNEYLSHADNADLSVGDIDFTLCGWLNPETTPSFAIVVSKGSFGGSYTLYLDSSDIFRFQVNGSVEAVASNFGALSTGQWYFWVAYHDSVNNLIGIAINAGTPNTTSHSAGVTDDADDFVIGALPGGGGLEQWDGLQDEVGFWKRVLTSQERTDLYNGGDGLTYEDLGGGGGGRTTFNTRSHPLGIRAGINRRVAICG